MHLPAHLSPEQPQDKPPPTETRTRAQAKQPFAGAPKNTAHVFAGRIFLRTAVGGDIEGNGCHFRGKRNYARGLSPATTIVIHKKGKRPAPRNCRSIKPISLSRRERV